MAECHIHNYCVYAYDIVPCHKAQVHIDTRQTDRKQSIAHLQRGLQRIIVAAACGSPVEPIDSTVLFCDNQFHRFHLENIKGQFL